MKHCLHPSIQAQDLVRNRDSQIIDLQKKLENFDVVLRQQLNINEAIRSERNVYSKNLVTAQDEIKEMKRKFKMMSHLIEQLKEELNSKDVALIKEHFDLLKVIKSQQFSSFMVISILLVLLRCTKN